MKRDEGGMEGVYREGGREGGWGEAAGQRRMGAGWGRGVVSNMSGPCGGGKGERGRGGAGRGGNGGANGHDIKLWECARQDLFSSKIRFYSATASSTTSTKIGQMLNIGLKICLPSGRIGGGGFDSSASTDR